MKAICKGKSQHHYRSLPISGSISSIIEQWTKHRRQSNLSIKENKHVHVMFSWLSNFAIRACFNNLNVNKKLTMDLTGLCTRVDIAKFIYKTASTLQR